MSHVFPLGNCHKIGDNVESRCDFNDVRWKGDRSEQNGCEGERAATTNAITKITFIHASNIIRMLQEMIPRGHLKGWNPPE